MKNHYDKNLSNLSPNHSMFNMFSDGLNKLKLKSTSVDPINSKFQLSATHNDEVQTSLADLEKLLAQLKTTSSVGFKKEENSPSNVNVKNNININVSNNFNMKSGLSSPVNKQNQSTLVNNPRINKSVSPVGDFQSYMENILEQHPKLKLLQSINKEKKNQPDISPGKNVIDRSEIDNIDPKYSSNLSQLSDNGNLKESDKEMSPPNFGSSKVNNRIVHSKPPLPSNENKSSKNNYMDDKNNFEKINLSVMDKKNMTAYLDNNNNLNHNISIQSKPSAMTTPKNVYNKPKSNSVKPKVSLNTNMINNDVPINNISSIQSFHRHVPSNSTFLISEKIQPDNTIISNILDPNLFPLSPQSNYKKLDESSVDFKNLDYLPAEKIEKEFEFDNKKSSTSNDMIMKLNDYSNKNNSLDLVTYKKPTTPSSKKDGKFNKSSNIKDDSFDKNMKSILDKKLEDEQNLNDTKRSARPSVKKIVSDPEKISIRTISHPASPISNSISINKIPKSPSSSTSNSPTSARFNLGETKKKENDGNKNKSDISSNRELIQNSELGKLENVFEKQIVKNNYSNINKSNISDSKNIKSPFVSPTARSKLHESRLLKKMMESKNSIESDNNNITNKNPMNMIENSKLSEFENTNKIPITKIDNINKNILEKDPSFVQIQTDLNTIAEKDKQQISKQSETSNPTHLTINEKEREKDIFLYNDKSKNRIENLLNQSQAESNPQRSKILNDTSFNDSIIFGKDYINVKTEPEKNVDPKLINNFRKILVNELIKNDDKLSKSEIYNQNPILNLSNSLDMSMDAKSNKSINKSRSSEVDKDLLFERITDKLKRNISPDKGQKNQNPINDSNLNTSLNTSLNNFKLNPDSSNLNPPQNLNSSLKKQSILKNPVTPQENLNNSNLTTSPNRQSFVRMKNIGIQEINSNKDNSKISRKSLIKEDSLNDVNQSSSKIFNKSYNAGDGNDNPNKSVIRVITNDPANNDLIASPNFNDLSDINIDIKEPNQTIHSVQQDYDMIKFKNKDPNLFLKESEKNNDIINHSNLNLNKSNLDKTNQSDDFVQIKVDPNPKVFVSRIREKNVLTPLPNLKNTLKNPEVSSSTFDTFFKQQTQNEVNNKHQIEENKPQIIESIMYRAEPDLSKIIMNKPDPQKNPLESSKIIPAVELKSIDDNLKKEADISNSKVRKGGNNNSIFNTFNNKENNTSNEASRDNSDDSVSEVQIMNPNTARKSLNEPSKIMNDSAIKENTITNQTMTQKPNKLGDTYTPKSPVKKTIPIRKSINYQNQTQENIAKSSLENSKIEDLKFRELTQKKESETANLIQDLSKDSIDVRNSVIKDLKMNTNKNEINKKDTIKNETQPLVTNSSISEQSFNETSNHLYKQRKSQLKTETGDKPYQNLVSENNMSESIKKENSMTSDKRGRRKTEKNSRKSVRHNSKYGSDKELLSKDKSFNEEKFNFISNFDKEEELYHEKVRNYEEIFKTIDRSLVNRRRNGILSNSFYKDSIMNEANVLEKYKRNPKIFSEYFEEALIKHEAEKDFNTIFKDFIGHDNNHKSEVAEMLKNSLMKNSRLGTLKKTNIFAKTYDFENSGMSEILEKFSAEVSFIREIKCDGDSFFRVFMFSLLEYYILNHNIHEIKKLVLGIYNMNDDEDTSFSKMKGIDFKIVLIIFNLIMENMIKNNIHKAYEILINAYYLEDVSFDMVLIGYMRITLWMMITKLLHLEQLQESTKKNVKDKKKNRKKKNDPLADKISDNTSTNNFELDKFNFDVILMYHNEPNKLVLALSTLVFNVNMDIFVFDGSLNYGKNHDLAYNKTRIAASDVNELPVISLCYYMSNYYKAYNKQFTEKHNFYLMKFLGSENEPKVQLGGKFDCDKCGTDKKKIYLLKYSMMACFDCLKIYLDKIIEKRAEGFFGEDFNNREFYCRGIEIKDEVLLDEHDLYKIYGTNIGRLLLNILKESCIVCKKKFTQKSDLLNVECGCIICKWCLKELVEKATNGQFIQNEFEKKYLRYKISCLCDKEINIDEMIKLFNESYRDKNEDAKRRLDDYATHYCMNCCNLQINPGNEININSTSNDYHQFNVLFNENEIDPQKEIARVPHVLCKKCVAIVARKEEGEKMKLKGQGAEIKIKPNYKTIYCNICIDDHFMSMIDWNRMNKKARCGCLII